MGRKTIISFEDIMLSELHRLENHYSDIIKENRIMDKLVDDDLMAYFSSMSIKDTSSLERELSKTYDGLDKDMMREVYSVILEAYAQGYKVGKYMKSKNIKH